MITFTVPEAAKAAHVNERTLRRAIAAGEIPAVKASDRHTLVWWDDVLEWIKKTPRPKPPPARPLASKRTGTVYFMQVGELIKIGYTTNLASRIRSLGGTVLATIPGTMADEKALHMRFGLAWERGEYFRPDPSLLRFIENIRDKAT